MAIQKAGRLQFQDLFEVVGVGAFTVDFGNAATGSGTFAGSGALTVPGAALGDIVLVGAGIDPIDSALVGHVTAANTVEVTLLNNTAGAVNLASQTLRIVVLRIADQYDIV
jgi:hypothetical protein